MADRKLGVWLAPLAVVSLLAAMLAWTAQGESLPSGISKQGNKYVADKDGMEMILVPAGEFMAGSDHGSSDEKPRHRVALGAFLIDKHEVTNAQFARFVKESSYRSEGPWRRGFGPGQEDHPVRFVNWNDASAYAKWAGRSLPTEAQWERAARGSKGTKYPWGNEFESGMARTEAAPSAGPVRVGSFPAGATTEGGLDFAGNVWEWVADWYDRHYYATLKGKTTRDPRGPKDGAPPAKKFVDSHTAAGNERSTLKVIRGGGWGKGGAENTRLSKRMWGNPRYWFNDTGFRCAVSMGGG